MLRVISIVDYDGIDLRAAARLARPARTFRSRVVIVCDGRLIHIKHYADGDELPIEHCRSLEIRACGPDAEAAVATLARMVLTGGESRRLHAERRRP